MNELLTVALAVIGVFVAGSLVTITLMNLSSNLIRWWRRRTSDAYAEIGDYFNYTIFFVKQRDLHIIRTKLGMHDVKDCKSRHEAMQEFSTMCKAAADAVEERG